MANLAERVRVAAGARRVALITRAAVPGARVLACAGWDEADLATLDGDVAHLVSVTALGTGLEPHILGRLVPGTHDNVALLVEGGEGDDRDLAARLGARRAGAALEVMRLRSDLDRAMAQILETDERLLGRIGLDIHDGPTQHLSVALLEVQLLEADLSDAAANGTVLPDGLLASMERIYETLGGALTEMRELIGHLRPAQFEDRRLSDILRDAITGFEGRSGTEVDATMTGEFPVNGVSVTQRITLYRILQEALNNAHRHGQARTITVQAEDREDGTLLRVVDDGRGFDAEAALRPRTGAPIARFGLHGMRDRAQMLGGTLRVQSAAGEGTALEVFLPTWRPDDDGADAA
ncbi:MAG: sensor histidine kinase [Thermoleophilia bacterium]